MGFKGKFSLLAVCVTAVLGYGLSIQGATLKYDGFVSRDKQTLQITATLEGTLDEIGQDDSTLAARLQVFILETDPDKPIIYDASNAASTDTNLNAEFYWENIEDPYSEEITVDRYQVRYSIQVVNNTVGRSTGEKTIETLLAENGDTIRTRLRFLRVDQSATTSLDDKALRLLTTVPNEAPANFAVAAIHKGVRLQWQGNSEVPYTSPSANGEAEPSSYRPQRALIMVFPRNEANQISLQGGQVNSDTGFHDDIDCLFSYDEDNPSECITCPDNPPEFFIKSNQESDLLIFNLVENNSVNASRVVSGLDIETEYVAVMQYEEGAKRTECKSITPIETKSLTELNGEDDGIEGDPRCFIASAAFGSPFVHEVKVFRWFRDTFLMPFEWGKTFVEFYYEYSPMLAETMSHSAALRSAIRFLLWPVAWALGFAKKVWESEHSGIFLFFLLGTIFVGFLVHIRYRFNPHSNN